MLNFIYSVLGLGKCFASKVSKKYKLPHLLIFLLYHTSQLALLYKVISIWILSNNIIYHFQKYLCIKLCHCFIQ